VTHRREWRVLATTDPIPGEVAGIKDAADDYERIKRALQQATEDLTTVIQGEIGDQYDSQAVDAIKESATTIRDGLSKVTSRYSVAACQLKEYADALEKAQTKADQAETEAQKALDARRRAEDDAQFARNTKNRIQQNISASTTAVNRSIDSYNESVRLNNNAGPGIETFDLSPMKRSIDRQKSELDSLKTSYDRAQQALAEAERQIQIHNQHIDEQRKKLEAAIKERDAAAQKAADAIRSIMDSDGQNDTWWDDWGSKIADFIGGILEWLGEMVGKVIAGIVQIIQGLIQAMQSLRDLANAFVQGILTGDWDDFGQALQNLANSVKIVLKGISTLADGLSSILTIVGIFLVLSGVGAGAGAALLSAASILSLVKSGSDLLFAVSEGDWSAAGWAVAMAGVSFLTKVGSSKIAAKYADAVMSNMGNAGRQALTSSTELGIWTAAYEKGMHLAGLGLDIGENSRDLYEHMTTRSKSTSLQSWSVQNSRDESFRMTPVFGAISTIDTAAKGYYTDAISKTFTSSMAEVSRFKGVTNTPGPFTVIPGVVKGSGRVFSKLQFTQVVLPAFNRQ
jgi:predicted  nucleic acid-binding Zn-ribbon protein